MPVAHFVGSRSAVAIATNGLACMRQRPVARYPGQTSAGKKMKECEIENGGRELSRSTPREPSGVPMMVLLMVLPGAARAEARRYGCLRRLGRLCRRCRSRPARSGRHCSVAAHVLEGLRERRREGDERAGGAMERGVRLWAGLAVIWQVLRSQKRWF